MNHLVNLPPEVLFLIMDYLETDDILELRATCRTMKQICSKTFMSQTLYINYCRFPIEFFDHDLQSVPEKIVFGPYVQFEGFDLYPDFFREFGQNFTDVTLNQCQILNTEYLVFFLSYFTNLKRLDITVDITESSLYNQTSYFLQNPELLAPVLKNVQSLSMENILLPHVEFQRLTALMPALEDIKLMHLYTHSMSETFSDYLSTHFSYLKRVDFGKCHLDTKFFEELLKIENLHLEKFSFSINLVNEWTVMKFLETQPQLEEMEIYHSFHCSNAFFEFVGNSLRELRSLSFKNGFPELKGLACLRELRKLESFELIDARNVYGDSHFDPDFHASFGIEDEYPAMRNLTFINFKRPICSACWEIFTKAFPNIQSLNLEDIEVDVKSFGLIVSKFPLINLKMDRCSITQLHINGNLTEQVVNLRHLNIKRNPIESIPFLPSLKSLDASNTLIQSVECTNLKKLIVDDCRNINRSPVNEICKNFGKLKYLDISRCQVPHLLREVMETCKNLRILLAVDDKLEIDVVSRAFTLLPNLEFFQFGTHGTCKYNWKNFQKIEKGLLSFVYHEE